MIITLTAPRSGSSLTCSILAAHGLEFGKCIDANHNNPRGYYENKAMNRLMKRAGKVSDGVMVEPPSWWGDEAKVVISKEKLTAVKSNVLRMSLWDSFKPTYLLVKRDRKAVIASNQRANMMKEAALLAQFDAIDALSKQSGIFVCEPDRFFHGDFGGLPSALAAEGVGFDGGLALSLLDESLWNKS